MKQTIVKEGNKISIKGNVEILKELKSGNYLLVFNEKKEEFDLFEQPDFKIPEKIYGKELQIADKYVDTFKKRKGKPLGIWLSGRKGTGKSLTAQLTCIKSELPVIIINQKHVGEKFYSFIASLNFPCVIFIDEFEKIYPEEEDQETFLSILDGTLSSNKMFIFTTNTTRISQYLKNRPGRIFYAKDYANLDKETVDEIIDDLLDNKEEKFDLKTVLLILGQISVDVLISIIEEMNMYELPAAQAVEHLNVEVEIEDFDVTLILDGKRFTTTADFNPLKTTYFWLQYHDHISDRYQYFSKERSGFKLSVDTDSFVFTDKQHNKLIFKPMKAKDTFKFTDIKSHE